MHDFTTLFCLILRRNDAGKLVFSLQESSKFFQKFYLNSHKKTLHTADFRTDFGDLFSVNFLGRS